MDSVLRLVEELGLTVLGSSANLVRRLAHYCPQGLLERLKSIFRQSLNFCKKSQIIEEAMAVRDAQPERQRPSGFHHARHGKTRRQATAHQWAQRD